MKTTIDKRLEEGKIYSVDREEGFTYAGLNANGEYIFARFIEYGKDILVSPIKKDNIKINGTDIKSKNNQYPYFFISPDGGYSELVKMIAKRAYSELTIKINMSRRK